MHVTYLCIWSQHCQEDPKERDARRVLKENEPEFKKISSSLCCYTTHCEAYGAKKKS